jgi:hypothetical protein
LKNLKHAAAMVLKSGKRGYVEKKLTLYETFDVLQVELTDTRNITREWLPER